MSSDWSRRQYGYEKYVLDARSGERLVEGQGKLVLAILPQVRMKLKVLTKTPT
jgi:hypothetical protein